MYANEIMPQNYSSMETYYTWARFFELQRYYSWIIDRFHISTRMYQLKNNNVDYHFTWLEQRLKRLGFRIAFLTHSPESFVVARKERLIASWNPGQIEE